MSEAGFTMNEAGFTMVALVLAVAVINIALGVAVTRWSFTMKRQREAELVWRGERYARALDCYAREHGALPTRLEDLVEARCIRRLYEDPMSESGEWRVLRVEDVMGDGGMEDPVEPDRDSPIIGDTMSESGRGLRERVSEGSRLRRRRGSGDLFPDSGSLRDRIESGRRRSEVAGGPDADEERGDRVTGGLEIGAIVGVVSTSEEEAIREYSGSKLYSEWRFVAGGAPPPPLPIPGLTPLDPGVTESPQARPAGEFGVDEGSGEPGPDGGSGLRERTRSTSRSSGATGSDSR